MGHQGVPPPPPHQFKFSLKPIFHWKLGLRWVTKANEMDTNNIKSTWPTPAPCIGNPKGPIFHLLALGVRFRNNANFRVYVGSAMLFGYQHVGIPPKKFSCWGNCTTRTPNVRGFALQWNIGFILVPYGLSASKSCQNYS